MMLIKSSEKRKISKLKYRLKLLDIKYNRGLVKQRIATKRDVPMSEYKRLVRAYRSRSKQKHARNKMCVPDNAVSQQYEPNDYQCVRFYTTQTQIEKEWQLVDGADIPMDEIKSNSNEPPEPELHAVAHDQNMRRWIAKTLVIPWIRWWQGECA